jgi:hypothetical protein
MGESGAGGRETPLLERPDKIESWLVMGCVPVLQETGIRRMRIGIGIGTELIICAYMEPWIGLKAINIRRYA